MPIPSSAIYDYIVRELAATEHEPDEAPITIVCEPLAGAGGASARGTLSMRLKAGTTPEEARAIAACCRSGSRGCATWRRPATKADEHDRRIADPGGPATVAGSASTKATGKVIAAPIPATLGLGLLVAPWVLIGSGIFGLPQNMAAGAGAILIGWTSTGIGMLLLVCVYQMLSVRKKAARAFVLATGQRAVIGSLDRIEAMRAGNAGMQVCTEAAGGADTL